MDFTPTEQQEELRASVRAFLVDNCPPGLVRKVFEAGDAEHDPSRSELWAGMTSLDWPALTIPERFGGLGLGAVESLAVAEELGRAVAPSPFMATVTQFVPVVRECAGDDAAAERFLRPVAEGRRTGTLALAEPHGRWDLGSVTATARRGAGGWVLDGTKSWVFDGASADEVAVVARAPGSTGTEGLGVFVVPGRTLPSAPLRLFDPTQPLADLSLASVEVPDDRVLIEPGDPRAPAALERAVEEAVVALAGSLTGTCRAIFETTLQYAKDRQQYGRPIGSFQAIKHRLVDLYVALERAAALATFAALTIAEDDRRRALAAAMAKAAAGDCQRRMVQDGLQLHGGIGFTWENDLHMYLKRAKSADLLFGTARTHRATVARLLGVGR